MINKKLGVLLLSGMTVMSTAAPVFALGEVGTEANPATVSVTKNLEFAEGITIPETAFNFNAKAKATAETPNAPEAKIEKISYTKTDVNDNDLKNGKYTVTKESKITFGNFPHAGVYYYNVTEEDTKYAGMTYSNKNYLLKVSVANGNNGTYVKNVVAEDQETTEKTDKVLFTNTYRKNGGQDSGTDSLVIRKDTTGEFANKTKKFEFELTFFQSATAQDTDKELTGTIGDETIKFVYGTKNTFKLSDGQELRFKTIPAGTKYGVKEVGATDGYTPKVTVIENDVKTKDSSAQNDGDSLSSLKGNNELNLIGENENKVTFVNEHKHNPVTGIIVNNMPMILAAGLGVLAMLGYTFTKRKFAKR